MNSHVLIIAIEESMRYCSLLPPLAEKNFASIIVPHRLSEVYGTPCDYLQVRLK